MMGLGSLRNFPWVETIGWILLRSIWQGAAVAAALAFMMGTLKSANAKARYAIACGAMVLMAALPLAGTDWRMPATAISGEHPRPNAPAWLAAVHTQMPGSARDMVVERLERLFPLIVSLWMAGALLLFLRLLGGWILAHRWVKRGTRPLVVPCLEGLKNRMGIRRAISLMESPLVDVPMVFGWLRPVLLLPVATLSGLSTQELEMILAHELAHIRRHDYLVNLVQCVAEVLMFYHPATWWITSVIRREREHCCDDLAVAVGGDRVLYCRALAALEGLRSPAFSLSQAANGGNLLARVQRLLNSKEESMKTSRMLVLPAVFLMVAPIWLTRADDRPAGASPASAVTPPQPNSAAAAGKPVATPVPEADLPPTEEEVWNKVVKAANAQHPGRNVQRNNLRIMIEKIGDKTDDVKFYPLAGPCQLVHRHYKGTAYFDEVWKDDGTGAATHTAKRVEVVYIDKDYLHRVRKPAGDRDLDLRESIDKAVREIEQLKQELERSGHEQGRKLDRLIKELKDLKREPLGMIDDAEAEKNFKIGMYYNRLGKVPAANFYFGRTRQRWPDSEWAAKSAREQVDIHRTGATGENTAWFNFAVGGVY